MKSVRAAVTWKVLVRYKIKFMTAITTFLDARDSDRVIYRKDREFN